MACTVRSKKPCRANSSSMWSRNGTPVSTSVAARRRRARASSRMLGLLGRARHGCRARPLRRAGARRAPRVIELSCHATAARCEPPAPVPAASRRSTAARVGFEPLERARAAPRPARAGASVARPGLDHAGALDEVVDAERRREARRAAGRQHVVRSGQVVAERLGRVGADEDRRRRGGCAGSQRPRRPHRAARGARARAGSRARPPRRATARRRSRRSAPASAPRCARRGSVGELRGRAPSRPASASRAARS